MNVDGKKILMLGGGGGGDTAEDTHTHRSPLP